MNANEKLIYTKGEKFAEIAAIIVTACAVAGYILMFALGKISGEAIIMLILTVIIYGICTLCSVSPQHANVFSRPENCTEKQFRHARRWFIIGKIALVLTMFLIAVSGLN